MLPSTIVFPRFLPMKNKEGTGKTKLVVVNPYTVMQSIVLKFYPPKGTEKLLM